MKKRVKHFFLHQHFETDFWEQKSLKGDPESTQKAHRALKNVCTEKSHK